jgi:hypothetical protein
MMTPAGIAVMAAAAVMGKARVPFPATEIAVAGRRVADVDMADTPVVGAVAALPTMQVSVNAAGIAAEVGGASGIDRVQRGSTAASDPSPRTIAGDKVGTAGGLDLQDLALKRGDQVGGGKTMVPAGMARFASIRRAIAAPRPISAKLIAECCASVIDVMTKVAEMAMMRGLRGIDSSEAEQPGNDNCRQSKLHEKFLRFAQHGPANATRAHSIASEINRGSAGSAA